jgi:thiol-disulfide isomerase/thioredoxin
VKAVRLVILGGVLLALAGTALILGKHFSQPLPTSGVESEVSQAVLLAVSFPDLTGKPQSLGQWQGKLLVINFWATWCAPCREEIPALNRIQNKYSAKGLQIVGIAADTTDKVSEFHKEMAIGYPLLIDQAGAIEFSRRLGNRFGLLPHTVVIDAGGNQIFSKLGAIHEQEFDAIIMKNLPK